MRCWAYLWDERGSPVIVRSCYWFTGMSVKLVTSLLRLPTALGELTDICACWFSVLSFSFYVGGLQNECTFDCRQRLFFLFWWLSIQKCLGVLVSDAGGGHTDDPIPFSASLARWQMTEDDEYWHELRDCVRRGRGTSLCLHIQGIDLGLQFNGYGPGELIYSMARKLWQ